MRVSLVEASRATLGALVGILLAGLITRAAMGEGSVAPMLIAPMGASAVLLFAAPSSPLAQPWSILAGNCIAAAIGVTIAGLVGDPILAAALALSLAIGAMLATQSLHPPSGAVALTAVLGGPAVLELGYGFVFWPVAVNSLLLVVAAMVFNRLTGRAYPTVPVKAADDSVRTGLLDVQPTDVEAVLRQYDEIVNVTPEVLEHLLEQAQIRAFQRSAGQLACASIMSPVAATVLPTTPVRTIWALMQRAELRALPVVDRHGGLVGIISRTDFFVAHLVDQRGKVKKWQIGFPRLRAHDLMSRNVQSALPETLVSKLVSPMVDQGLHQIPIVDASNRVVGMVSQADLLSGLFRSGFERVAEFPKQPQSIGDVSLSSAPA
ncbi:HPP family protein [Pelagibacterium luteolum]|uniref:HPP family protein n=1 Tax=Pelagibacterium luteolum TaxID=440168 RepID=UPI003CC79C81